MSPSSSSNDARPAATVRAPPSSTSATSSGYATTTTPPKRDDRALLPLARVTAKGLPYMLCMREVKPTAEGAVATTRLLVSQIGAAEMKELRNPLGVDIPAVSDLDASRLFRVPGVSGTDVFIINRAEGAFGVNLVEKRVYPIVDAETAMFALTHRGDNADDCSIVCEGDHPVGCWSGAWPAPTREAFRAKGTWSDNRQYAFTSHARAVEVAYLIAYLNGTDPEDVGDLRSEVRLPVLLDLVYAFGIDGTATGTLVLNEVLRFAGLPHTPAIKAAWLVGTADYHEAITQSNLAGGMDTEAARPPIPSLVQQVVASFAAELRGVLIAEVTEPGSTGVDAGKLDCPRLLPAIDYFTGSSMEKELEAAKQQAAQARAAKFEQLYLQQQAKNKQLEEQLQHLSNEFENLKKRARDQASEREKIKKSRKDWHHGQEEDGDSSSEDGEVSSDDKPLRKGTSQEPKPAKTAEKARPPRGH